MGRIWRRGFVGLLAIVLIAGGLPLAHATPCEAVVEKAHAVSSSDNMDANHAHHHHVAEAQAATAGHPQHGGQTNKTLVDLCKCLNCNMCTTPAVAPVAGSAQLERRSFAVSYMLPVAGDRSDLLFVDPGIPIRTA